MECLLHAEGRVNNKVFDPIMRHAELLVLSELPHKTGSDEACLLIISQHGS